jgi:hypothetical protein
LSLPLRLIVRYRFSDGREQDLALDVTEVHPSGLDMSLHCEAREWADRLLASRIVEASLAETGEIIAEPVRWFRRSYLRIHTTPEGLVPLACFLDALPVEQLGPTTAGEMARVFDTPERALSEILAVLSGDRAAMARLDAIPGVGPGLIAAIAAAPRQELLVEIEQLLREHRLEPFRKRAASARLHGLRVVFTGTFGDVTRGELHQMAIEAGALVASSVGKRVNFVVVGQAPGSKLAKAQKLGVEVIDLTEFFTRVGVS